MALHNELGKKGELAACEFLLLKGYEIIATNWRNEKAEADIIARKENLIILAEVKTRSTEYYGLPEEAVGKRKQKMMVKAAEAFLEEYKLNNEVRYDIIAIIINEKEHKIEHIEDAFYPYSNELGE